MVDDARVGVVNNEEAWLPIPLRYNAEGGNSEIGHTVYIGVWNHQPETLFLAELKHFLHNEFPLARS